MAIITYWQDPLTQKTMIPIYNKVMCDMILWQVCILSLGMFIKNSKGVVYIWMEKVIYERRILKDKNCKVEIFCEASYPAIWLIVFLFGQ